MSEPARIQREIVVLRAELFAIVARLDRLEAELQDHSARAYNNTAGGSTTPPSTGGGTSAADYTRAEREDAAKQTGRFFARCLAGRPRGESGRGRIQLPNRIFVVVKNFRGQIFTEPVRVYTAWAPVKRLVAEEGNPQNFGDSIFAGFAAKWEAEVAVCEAGLSWPPSLVED